MIERVIYSYQFLDVWFENFLQAFWAIAFALGVFAYMPSFSWQLGPIFVGTELACRLAYNFSK